MILVLSGDDDLHADEVEGRLRDQGAEVARVDPARFPDDATLSVRLAADGSAETRLRVGGTTLDLEEVRALWVRRPGRPGGGVDGRPGGGVDGRPGGGMSATTVTDSRAALADVWESLDALALPGTPDVIAHAAHKGRQLRLAGRLGFEIPPTLTGNDPDDLLDLVAATDGPVITKRCAPDQRMVDPQGEPVGRFSQLVRPRDLVHADALRACPITAQAYVAKAREVRVTVVADRAFAAAIDSQRDHHARHDWRRAVTTTPMTPHALPTEVADRCVAVTRALGLTYAAVDLVLTPDGRYVFLEANPTGQYLWVEDATGLPISAAVADLLLAAERAGVAGVAAHPSGGPLP